MSNPKNIHNPFPKNIHAFIVNNQTTPILSNHDQKKPTKFGGEKKTILPYTFFTRNKEKKSCDFSLICYTSDIYSSKDNVLRD